jgi:hypothetical protein
MVLVVLYLYNANSEIPFIVLFIRCIAPAADFCTDLWYLLDSDFYEIWIFWAAAGVFILQLIPVFILLSERLADSKIDILNPIAVVFEAIKFFLMVIFKCTKKALTLMTGNSNPKDESPLWLLIWFPFHIYVVCFNFLFYDTYKWYKVCTGLSWIGRAPFPYRRYNPVPGAAPNPPPQQAPGAAPNPPPQQAPGAASNPPPQQAPGAAPNPPSQQAPGAAPNPPPPGAAPTPTVQHSSAQVSPAQPVPPGAAVQEGAPYSNPCNILWVVFTRYLARLILFCLSFPLCAILSCLFLATFCILFLVIISTYILKIVNTWILFQFRVSSLVFKIDDDQMDENERKKGFYRIHNYETVCQLFLEDCPQFILQILNTTRRSSGWNLLAYISTTLSCLNIGWILFKYSYSLFWSPVHFRALPWTDRILLTQPLEFDVDTKPNRVGWSGSMLQVLETIFESLSI